MTAEQGESLGNRLGLVGLCTAIFYFNFLARVVLSPLLPAIEQDLGIRHAAAGNFFLLLSVGYAAALLAAGFLGHRVTHHRLIVFSAVAVGLALFGLAAGRSLPAIHAALLVLGFAGGLYLPSGMSAITAAVAYRHWGMALGMHEIAPALGFLSAPLVSEALLQWFSWRGVLAAVGLASMALGLVFHVFGRGGLFRGDKADLSAVRSVVSPRTFWAMAILFSLAIGASVGVFSMLPLYLVAERGMERACANTLLGLSRIPVLFVAFWAGWFSDRFGPGKTILLVCVFNGVTTILLGTLPGPWVWLAIVAQPMMNVCFFPAGFTILSRFVPPALRGLSISLTMFLSYLAGGGLMPVLIGAAGDLGSFSAAIVTVGAAMLCSSLLLRYLPAETRAS